MKKTMSAPSLNRSVRRALQAGFTVVEMMVVLAIGAVLIAGAVYGYQMVYTSKAQNEMKYLDQAMECSRNVYANQANFAGAAIATLVNNNCFPASLAVGKATATATVNNSFGGAITVAAVNLNGTNDGLEITIPGLPSDVCVNMLRLMSKPARITAQATGAGAATTVMALGAAQPDLSQSIACGNATTATLKAAILKS